MYRYAFKLRPREIPRTGDDRPVGGLFAYVWRMSGWHQVALAVMALVVAALAAAPLELQRRVVDDALAKGDVRLLVVLCGIYLAAVLAQIAMKFALRLYQAWIGESAVRYTRRHLATFLDNRQADGDRAGKGGVGSDAGEDVSILLGEAEKLGGFVGDGVSEPIAALGTLLALLGYMIWVEPLVALASLPFMALQLAVVPLVQRVLNRLIERRVAGRRRLGTGIAELAAKGRNASLTRANRRTDAVYARALTLRIWKQILKSTVNGLSALAPIAVLLAGGLLVVQGETTVGVLVAFLSGFQRLTEPLRDVITHWRVAAQAAVQHRMIAQWM